MKYYIKSCMTLVFAFVMLFTSVQVSALPSKTKKEIYYKKYQAICKKVNEEKGTSLGVMPINEIKDEELISPDLFEKTMRDITTADYKEVVAVGNILNDKASLSGNFSKTKSYTVKVSSIDSIDISCKLTGTYYYNKTMKRCFFGKINNPAFTVSGGSWKNRGYLKSLIDGSRTADIDIKGKAIVGNNYSNNFTGAIEFYCTEEGYIR